MFNKYKQNKILPSLSALALINTAAFSGIVAGQSQATVEEIVVTARKKAESLQDVPVSVSALREETLEEKGINVFEDYLLQFLDDSYISTNQNQKTTATFQHILYHYHNNPLI